MPTRPADGEMAPHIALRSHHGETVELAAAAGQRVLLMFYPFAFSRVCGSELREVHRRWEEFRQVGARVLAISCDSVHALRAYADELSGSAEQPGPELLSDFWPHGAAAQAYGVFNPVTGGPQRVSFLLDETLRVRHQIASVNNEPRSLDQTLSLLNSL